MAAGAVEIVRGRLEQKSPGGVRIGSAQTSGALALYPIFVEGPSLNYATLAEAEKNGTAEISEKDQHSMVARLTVRNRGDLPMLMIDGDLLLGLKQDRVLNTTILVAPRSQLDVPVSCVEAGRWRHRSSKAHRIGFSVSPGIRATKRKSSILRARTFGEFDSDQHAVWDEVDRYARSLGVKSPTHAYSDVLKQGSPEIERRLAQFQPEPGQCGLFATVAGKAVSFDLFDKPSTLAKLWQGLVASCLTEALLTPTDEASVDVEAASAWIRGLGEGEASVHSGVGLGEAALISGEAHDLSALVVDGVPVHIAASARDGR